MTPPEAPEAGNFASAAGSPAEVFSVCNAPLTVLRQRADFVRASHALRQGSGGFHLQARPRAAAETATGIRVGFTCSKKVGNAVARNRAKRRLREAARAVLPQHGRDGWDYVLVGKRDATAAIAFASLTADLVRAIDRIHQR